MPRDNEHNPDPNINAARIVSESMMPSEKLPEDVEAAWAAWSAHFRPWTNGLERFFGRRLWRAMRQQPRHAVALHYFHYNFIRKHMTLKTTPAVAAGIASKPLTILDLVKLVEAEEAKLGERLTKYLPAKKG